MTNYRRQGGNVATHGLRFPRSTREGLLHPGPAIEGYNPERRIVGPAMFVVGVVVGVLLLAGVL